MTEIAQLEVRLRGVRETLTHVDATLALFDPTANPSKILAKRPYRRVKLFGPGKLNRLILGVLRKAEGPLKTLEIVDRVVAELDFGPDAALGMKSRVRTNLAYLAKVRGLVVKDGERETTRWRIAA